MCAPFSFLSPGRFAGLALRVPWLALAQNLPLEALTDAADPAAPTSSPWCRVMPQVSDRYGARGVQRKARDAGHAGGMDKERNAALRSPDQQMPTDET